MCAPVGALLATVEFFPICLHIFAFHTSLCALPPNVTNSWRHNVAGSAAQLLCSGAWLSNLQEIGWRQACWEERSVCERADITANCGAGVVR